MSRSQKEFERYHRDCDLNWAEGGKYYTNMETHRLWQCWQAAIQFTLAVYNR